jgi:hypothetical protein
MSGDMFFKLLQEKWQLEGNLTKRGALFLSVIWKIRKYIAKVKEVFAKLPSLIYQNKKRLKKILPKF